MIRKTPKHRITPEKRQQIISTYHPGMTLIELSKIVGVSDSACMYTLHKAGIKTPSRRWFWTDELDKQLIELCNSGLNSVQVAKAMHIKVRQVLNRVSVMRHNGVNVLFPTTSKSKCK